MSQFIHGILTLTACYLMGSLLFALIISESAYGVDIRKFGSGNCGFTNMKRTLGWKPALVVLFLDAAKGALAVWVSRRVFTNQNYGQWHDMLVVLGAILAIVGHNWSVFCGFAGGKGVATSLGVLIALHPQSALLAVLVGFPMLVYPGYMSLASVAGTASVPIWLWHFKQPAPYQAFGLLALAFVLIRHRANLTRLYNGTEPKFSFSGATEPMPRPQPASPVTPD
nr:glycerol-3-phosphate 1-O-acyltransferase PlsY [Armatimonadota bacterium]